MPTVTLHDAFIDELRDAYDAEKQLLKALPTMIEAASSPELIDALQTHMAETEQHVTRLETVFEGLDEKPRGKRCDGMAGILTEGKAVLEKDLDELTRDACLVAAGQRAEHYEMAAYGTLVAWAHAMGHDEAVDLLQQNLDDEKAADLTLTRLATGGINQEAAELAHPPDEDDEAEATRPASAAETSEATGGMRARKTRR